MVKLSDLFDMKIGHNLDLNALDKDKNGIAYVARTRKNNGNTSRVKKHDAIEPAKAGTVTTVLVGNSTAYSFVQEEDYYTSQNMMILTPKIELTYNEKLYYCLCIKQNAYKFNYGRNAHRTLKDLVVPEPKEIPGWVNKMKMLDVELHRKAVSDKGTPELDVSTWREFKYSDLFETKRGKISSLRGLDDGKTPVVTAASVNNGITAWVAREPKHRGNTITISGDGVNVGEAFYQAEPYLANTAVNVLTPKFELNSYIAMFLCTIIRKEKFKYNYGRKWSLTRMRNSIIKLPVDEEGNPDWQFMEEYIKTLPFSDSLPKEKKSSLFLESKREQKPLDDRVVEKGGPRAKR